MQNVEFKCDGCGVKLPSVDVGADTEPEKRFFRVDVAPSVVHSSYFEAGLPQAGQPSHNARSRGLLQSLDICRACAETKPLISLLTAPTPAA